jgi:DNA polymerase III gamma/tau subunit
MSKKEFTVGYLRINQLMLGMITAVEDDDKDHLVKLIKNFMEDTNDFAGVLLQAADVTDDDLAKHDTDDEELVKDAASADQIRTALVKS